MSTCIQIRRSDAFEWEAANPVLAEGEIGFERDTGRLKIGNGVLPWVQLRYALDTVFTEDEKKKLEAVQPGATAAGVLGDEHARATGNPHCTTAAEVGAEPLGAVAAALATHQQAAAIVHSANQISDTADRMLLTAAERNKLSGLPASAAPASHVGAAGNAAHPSALASVNNVGGASGFMSARDKEKLNGIAAGAQANPAQVSAAECVAGTETATRSYSPLDIKTMVQGHALTSVPNADGLADGSTKVIMTLAERNKLNDIDQATAPRAHVGAGGVAEHALVVPSVGATGGVAGFMGPQDKEKLDKLGPGNYGVGARNIGAGTGLFSGRRTVDDEDRGALEVRSLLGRQGITTSLSSDGTTVILDSTAPALSGPALLAAIDAALGNVTWRTGGTARSLPAAAQTITNSSTPISSPTVFLSGSGGSLQLPLAESGVHAIDIINDGSGPWSLISSAIVEGMLVTADLTAGTASENNLKVLSFEPHSLPSTDKLTLSWVMYPGSSNQNWMLLSNAPGGGANLVEIGSSNLAGGQNAAIMVQVKDASNAWVCDVRWPYTKNQLSVCYLTIDLTLPAAELWINGTLIPIATPFNSASGSPKWPPLPGSNFSFAAANRSRLWIAGGQGTSRQEFDGALGRLWLMPQQYLPGAENASKFCTANAAQPVYLGATGQLPTGTPPAYYLNGDGRDFAINRGSLGGLGTFDPMVATRVASASAQFPFRESMSWGTAPLTIPVGGTAALRRKATSPLTTWVDVGS